MSKIIGHALETARAQQRAQVAESENKKLMAVLEYLAMMTDVNIEAEEDENYAE